MTEQLILRELHSLPETLKVEVLHFVQFLKQNKSAKPPLAPKRRKAGSAKDKYILAPDFDAPLDEFKEYMS